MAAGNGAWKAQRPTNKGVPTSASGAVSPTLKEGSASMSPSTVSSTPPLGPSVPPRPRSQQASARTRFSIEVARPPSTQPTGIPAKQGSPQMGTFSRARPETLSNTWPKNTIKEVGLPSPAASCPATTRSCSFSKTSPLVGQPTFAKEAWAPQTTAQHSTTSTAHHGTSILRTAPSMAQQGNDFAPVNNTTTSDANTVTTPRLRSEYGGPSAASSERCSRCSMEAVWNASDVFWDFDRGHTGQITRAEYIEIIAESPSVMRLRIQRRAKLESRFRASVKPVSFDEFLELIWPTATRHDRQVMQRWAQLREAWHVLARDIFRGHESELKRVFDYLDGRGEGRVLARDIVRAQILSREDVQSLTKCRDLRKCWLDLETFRSQLWPHLKATYVTRETIIKMRREEDAMISNTFESAFRTGLGDKTTANNKAATK